MHGRPRLKGPEDPERVKAAKQKALLFGQLSKEVLGRRQVKQYDQESLALSAKLLELNPEVYTVWNYRREALLPVLEGGGAAAVAAAEGELALTEKALHRNPKSYSTWHHRKWVVGRRLTSLEHELRLVGMLLDADERNFHGWGYRRFIVDLMGTPAERALEFSRQKIDQNFSNYSAWHSRTVLLPIAHGAQQRQDELWQGLAQQAQQGASAEHVLPGPSPGAELAECSSAGGAEGGGGGEEASSLAAGFGGAAAAAQGSGAGSAGSSTALVPPEVLDEEYELVKQAFYTEPEDQSGWFYHRWLLGCSWAHWEQVRGSEAEASAREALLAVVLREQEMCQELLSIEPDSKWALLTSARLKEMQLQLLGVAGAAAAAGEGEGGESAAGAAAVAGGSPAEAEARQLLGEVRAIYAQLAGVDPMRAGYYGDAVAGRASVVMAAPTAAGGAARLQQGGGGR